MKEGRLVFGADGGLLAVDGSNVEIKQTNFRSNDRKWGNGERGRFNGNGFRGNSDLNEFNEEEGDNLGEGLLSKPVSNSSERSKITPLPEDKNWSLYQQGKRLEPLKFSNGKTQEDVVNEVVNSIKSGKKIIFLHGVCGTGKSAIALNIARQLGRASIVVPVKNLQKQYEEDYMGKKSVYKQNGEQLSIAMITGRDNHDSLIKFGASCADPFLPDTIAISEKNYRTIKEFYDANPLIKNKMSELNIVKTKRLSIAPANPYWSPIIPADIQFPLKDARQKKYKGLNGREFIFYHRKEGCSYFDQYQSYIDADVLIFNAAKYKIEVALDRKPATNIEIIDEADEFLDSFSSQRELNITRLIKSLGVLSPDSEKAQETIERVINLLKAEEQRVRAVGIDESQIFPATSTNLGLILKLIAKDSELVAEIVIDEGNYANTALEIAELFNEFIEDAYISYRKVDDFLSVNIVTTNISRHFSELVGKNKAFVFMSGTLHSPEVLERIFGIKDYVYVEAEGSLQGEIEIHKTGKEFDCKYETFKQEIHTKEDYYFALAECLSKAKKPTLVQVNAFEDLPTREDIERLGLFSLISREQLKEMQKEDVNGKRVIMFKEKKIDVLFSTKCSRGVDFPGDTCHSVVFTKFPYPNISGPFWKILKQTHPDSWRGFYFDKAKREFLQRIYRAVRSKEDHVFVLSPDLRVLNAVKDIQNGMFS